MYEAKMASYNRHDNNGIINNCKLHRVEKNTVHILGSVGCSSRNFPHMLVVPTDDMHQ